jgi:hypothetical protein
VIGIFRSRQRRKEVPKRTPEKPMGVPPEILRQVKLIELRTRGRFTTTTGLAFFFSPIASST